MALTEQKVKLRVASQVHAEAVAIVALRALASTITDVDTPRMIRERIRDLVAVKAAWITGDTDANFDALIGDTVGAQCKADAWLRETLARMRAIIDGGAQE